MTTNRIKIVVFVLLTGTCGQYLPAEAFTTRSTVRWSRGSRESRLPMAPLYDPATKRWEATNEDERTGYGPVGSLMRQGPVPFFIRLADQDKYEQGVLKMMASDSSMSREEAQGNMDAYLLNPNDWALQKMEEKNGAPKFDYANANMDTSDLVLTATWASILMGFAIRIAYVYANGCDSFCKAYHF